MKHECPMDNFGLCFFLSPQMTQRWMCTDTDHWDESTTQFTLKRKIIISVCVCCRLIGKSQITWKSVRLFAVCSVCLGRRIFVFVVLCIFFCFTAFRFCEKSGSGNTDSYLIAESLFGWLAQRFSLRWMIVLVIFVIYCFKLCEKCQ